MRRVTTSGLQLQLVPRFLHLLDSLLVRLVFCCLLDLRNQALSFLFIDAIRFGNRLFDAIVASLDCRLVGMSVKAGMFASTPN